MTGRLLRGCTLVDVTAGRVVPEAALLIQGEVLSAVGPERSLAVPAGAEVQDLGGAWIVPGFVDPHAHLALSGRPDAIDRVGDPSAAETWALAEANALAALRAGVTTLADCGAPGRFAADFQAAARGRLTAPRLLVSLRPITVPGGHGAHFGEHAHGEVALAETVDRLVDEGANFVKIMASGGGTAGATPPHEPQYTEAELAAVVRAAHRRGRPVVAHARATEAIRRAVRAGVDRLEHLTWEAPGVVAYDPGVAAELVARGAWADPTLPAGYRAQSSAAIPPTRRAELRAAFERRYPAYRRLVQEAGARLLCGTDAGTPLVAFDDFALGPELLAGVVGYGPLDALRSATLWGAEALGVGDSRGSLEAGKLADLVVLDEDPLLSSPPNLRAIRGVMLGGQWVTELDGASRPVRGEVEVSA